MLTSQEIIQKLRENRFKITPQRRIIVELISENVNHPTAEDIYKQVLVKLPDISQATIYNTLRELVALGILTSVDNIGEKGMRFDTNTNNHHHVYCMQCHQLVDIERDFPSVTLTEKEAQDYQIIRNQITFYGICKNCQKE